MNYFFSDAVIDTLEVAEKVIKENLNSFLTMFYSSPACMSITTEDRIFVKINKRFMDIYGYVEEEVIGRNSEQIGILDSIEHERVSIIMQAKGRIKNEIIKCKSKNGKLIYAISCIEKVLINGEYYWVSSFHDITPIKQQQQIIENQNREIIESISYARLIQDALFPSQSQIQAIIPKIFVLNKPKNIVSGDFYWIKERHNKIYVAVCDCTGHGVPGGFISVIGYKILNKFVNEYAFSNPADILNQMNLEYSLANKNMIPNTSEIKDGMDIALCVIDKTTNTMQYSGAYNPIYQVRDGVLTKLATDKIPIHLFTNHTNQKFTNYQIDIKSNDAYYLFSDGYADQFGGKDGKKFRYKNFQDLILSLQHLPMLEQKEILNNTIEDWKAAGGEEQTDDILVVGFKV